LRAPRDCFGEAREVIESLGEEPSVAGESTGFPCPVTLVAGGAERRDSVYNALKHLPDDCEWVLIHDGVRPLVSARLLEETWKDRP